MIEKLRDIYYGEFEHEHRFMMSLICAELIILLILKFWPVPNPPQKTYDDRFTDEVIFVEKSIPTKQVSAPAAPPKPQVPVPVPNDQVIEQEIDFPEFEDIIIPIEAEGIEGLSSTEGETRLVNSPERPPGLVRIVEPTISEAAKRANIKAQIKVTFLVDANGEVEEAFISEIRLYDGDKYEIVDQIGYGLMEATLTAAAKWRFTPAQHDGDKVRTYIENSFNIGF